MDFLSADGHIVEHENLALDGVDAQLEAIAIDAAMTICWLPAAEAVAPVLRPG